jgi:SPP1 gp7 family putative phage head morphogenesis protein
MTKPVLSIGFDIPFEEAIAWAKDRIAVLPDTYYNDLPAQARSRAFTIGGLSALDQIQGVLDSLHKATAKGETFDQWKKALTPEALALGPARLDNVFRTAIQTHYNIGRWQQAERNKAHRPYLMYDAINDGRTRPRHRALDNFIAPVDDPIWRKIYPPNGFRCRCSTRSLSEAQAIARGWKGAPNYPADGGADAGWEYNPATGQDARLEQIKAQRLAKAHADIRAAAEKALKESVAETVVQKPGIESVLDIPKRGIAKTAADAAIQAINKVHSLPDGLSKIPVKNSSSKSFQGSYGYYNGGDAIEIKVSSSSVNPGLTAIHEIGHFIDHQTLNGIKGYHASPSDPLFEAWRIAVDNSKASANIVLTRGAATSSAMRNGCDCYLSKHEQWARSYAQYIAKRSGDQTLIQQVAAIRDSAITGPYKYSQWADDDFEPIAKAIDDIFEKIGIKK